MSLVVVTIILLLFHMRAAANLLTTGRARIVSLTYPPENTLLMEKMLAATVQLDHCAFIVLLVKVTEAHCTNTHFNILFLCPATGFYD